MLNKKEEKLVGYAEILGTIFSMILSEDGMIDKINYEVKFNDDKSCQFIRFVSRCFSGTKLYPMRYCNIENSKVQIGSHYRQQYLIFLLQE